jgi:hypothetical protein
MNWKREAGIGCRKNHATFVAINGKNLSKEN